MIGTLITTFDVYKSRVPRIDIYGSEGSLGVPDPNTFGGPVQLFKAGAEAGREPRANGTLALHCLEIMHGLLESGGSGSFYEMTTTCERPEALAPGLADGSSD